jgi:methyltransferase (TIGR00027 family)
MTDESLIANVSDTSFWVAYYRAKESLRPDALFRDPFAQALIGERGKQISDSMGKISRYTEWAVITRTVIIDRFIEQLIAEGVDAVINLGAGLDTRPYRMNLPPSLEWIEADFPHIVEHKNRTLQSATPKCRLTRVAVDLSADEERRSFLRNAAPQAKKVLILTEGVIPYLSSEQVAGLAKDLLGQPRFSYWITEYFHQKVYRYLKATVRELKMQNSPFRFYPEDWYGFFRAQGWEEKETRYGSEIAVEFRRQPPMGFLQKIMMPFIPKKVKDGFLRMAGYVVFRRG